jgi:hypothetical protein
MEKFGSDFRKRSTRDCYSHETDGFITTCNYPNSSRYERRKRPLHRRKRIRHSLAHPQHLNA